MSTTLCLLCEVNEARETNQYNLLFVVLLGLKSESTETRPIGFSKTVHAPSNVPVSRLHHTKSLFPVRD